MNWQFDGRGNLVPFNRGIVFPSIYSSGGDGFRFNDYNQITSTVQRDISNIFLHYDASDALQFFAEGEYFYSRGDELVQQPTFNSSLFGGAGGPLTFSATSPFLTAQAKAQLAALGVTSFQVSRASDDLADLTGYSQSYIARGVIGARGDFKIGGRSFNYEVSANRGRTVIRDTSQDIDAQRFINAVNVVTNGSGQIVCTATPATQAAPGGTPDADASCVPLNLLGSGLSDPKARAYVIAQNVTRSVIDQAVFSANFGGTPFAMFGNDAAFNIGYEHRLEKGAFIPSDFQQQGLGRSAAIQPVSGKYNVDEVFGEVRLPFVQEHNNVPFIDRLEVNASGRYVDNTVNGGFFAWSAGATFAPVKDIAFRGNYTKSFRAPAITELYLPNSNAFSTVSDLCSPANINGGAAPATRKENCEAFLAKYPNATPLDANAATVPSQSGGNTALQNEVSRSFTYGFILQPRWVPGLSITADYVDIRIANPISSLSVSQIVSACFDNPSFNKADPANGNAFCSQIKRYASGEGGTAVNGGDRGGQVVNDPANPGVRSGFVNGKRIYFSGIQASVNYRTGLSGLGVPGQFAIDSDWLYVRHRLIDTTGVAPVRSDGVFGDPKFTGQVNVRYIGEQFGLTTSINIVGKQIATRNALSLDLREFNRSDAYATVNQSIYFKVNDIYRFNFSVTNLFNRIGQVYYGYYPGTLISDDFGRRYAMTVNMKF